MAVPVVAVSVMLMAVTVVVMAVPVVTMTVPVVVMAMTTTVLRWKIYNIFFKDFVLVNNGIFVGCPGIFEGRVLVMRMAMGGRVADQAQHQHKCCSRQQT